MTLAEKLQEVIKQEATILWPDIKLPPFDVTEPPNPEFGDLSSALSLTLAKLTQEKPIDIANKLKEVIQKKDIEHLKKITVTEPGYLNFIIDFSNLGKHLLSKILQEKDNYGVSKEDMGNVIIEHTSINPNKAAHVGHLRNACLGDSLARIMTDSGYSIEVENYIDDLGLQVADSVIAYEYFKKKFIEEFKQELPEYIKQNINKNHGAGSLDSWFWQKYVAIQKKYEKTPKLLEKRDIVLKEMEEGKNEVAPKIVEAIVSAHTKTLQQFNIDHSKSVLVYESAIINNHLWDNLFTELQDKKLINQSKGGETKGAWLVKFGESDREDKILVRSNSVPTYTAKDLAYQLWKFDKSSADIAKGDSKFEKADQVINVIDNRQEYPQAVIKYILNKLGYTKESENSHHLSYGVVKLSEAAIKFLGQKTSDKSSYAMSGRAGIGATIDDLLRLAIVKEIEIHETEEDMAKLISAGSIRYYMLKNRPKKDIIFDFDEILKSDGNTGVYLQYAYARSSGILNKVGDQYKYNGEEIAMPDKISAESKQLIKLLETYPKILALSASELDPSLLADYAFELANTFAKFYEKNPVLQADETVKIFRLRLVASFKTILKKLLYLLLGMDSATNTAPLEKI